MNQGTFPWSQPTLFQSFLQLLDLLSTMFTGQTTEFDISMMFGSAIAGLSYLWSFLLTLAFAAIVYAFMLIKLNRINMAESLKSNE